MAASSIPNVDCFKTTARDRLTYLLQTIPGKKDLILDPDLIIPFEKVAGACLLKQCGVEKIFKLEPQFLTSGNPQRVYIIRPTVSNTKYVADHINSDKSKQTRHVTRVDLIMIPRKLYFCEEIFEYEGVFGDINIDSLDLGFIPLDKDVLSLEIPAYFRDTFLNKDYTWIRTVANAIVEVQLQFGHIPNVYCQGNSSKLVYDAMKKFLNEKSRNQEIKKIRKREIGHLFIIDRDVDYASSLLTQLTYEGQLDENFSINCGFVVFGPEITGKKESTKLNLSSDAKLFEEIRNCHITKAFDVLYRKVKDLVIHAERRQNMSLSEVRQFVAKELPQHQQQHGAVSLHVGACECIIKSHLNERMKEQLNLEQDVIEGMSYQECLNYIEDGIILKFPKEQMLRFMCLLSCVQNGMPTKDYNSLRTKFLQSYGHEHLITFFNLAKLKLFMEQEIKLNAPTAGNLVVKMASSAISYLGGRSPFQVIARKLNLVPKGGDEYDYKNPTDVGYVFGGAYCPFACNFAQTILEKESLEGIEDAVKLLPGPTITDIQAKSARGKGPELSERVVLVCILGGVTYAEVSAFRLLGRLRDYNFIVASTSMINGKILMQTAFPV